MYMLLHNWMISISAFSTNEESDLSGNQPNPNNRLSLLLSNFLETYYNSNDDSEDNSLVTVSSLGDDCSSIIPEDDCSSISTSSFSSISLEELLLVQETELLRNN